MRKMIVALMVCAVAVSGVAVSAVKLPALAQEWQGEYTWVGTPEEKALIEKTVEEGAQQVNRLIRSIARGRLTKSTKPVEKITFAVATNVVTMTRGDGETPVSSVADGSKVEWKRKDGDKFIVTQTLEKNTLTQTFTDSDDSTRVSRYVFAEDGKSFELHVTINSSSLKTPLNYAITYRK